MLLSVLGFLACMTGTLLVLTAIWAWRRGKRTGWALLVIAAGQLAFAARVLRPVPAAMRSLTQARGIALVAMGAVVLPAMAFVLRRRHTRFRE